MLLSTPSVPMLGGASCKHVKSSKKWLSSRWEVVMRLTYGNQRWLPESTSGLIVSPRTGASINKVSDLFHINSKQWNFGFIDSVFYPWEAEMIKGIYVSEECNEDVLVWPLSPNGEYSVWSAYRMPSSTTT